MRAASISSTRAVWPMMPALLTSPASVPEPVGGGEDVLDVGLVETSPRTATALPPAAWISAHTCFGRLDVAGIVDDHGIAARSREPRGRRADAAAAAGDDENAFVGHGRPLQGGRTVRQAGRAVQPDERLG